MPEPEGVAGLGQHARGAGVVDGRDQVCHAAAQHDRQVRHGKVHAQQGRRPQYLTHRPGNKAQAVGGPGGPAEPMDAWILSWLVRNAEPLVS